MRLVLKRLTERAYSSSAGRTISKSIYISKCTDIFTNLALEDWLYKNRDFTDHHLLVLWRNEPCVVIGRHQNPWLECNFAALSAIGAGVKLARRNSGGGTVYHDMDNLNLTFFTTRSDYSRRRNLELIARALKKGLNIESTINKREDLCIGDRKISGTASKLGRTTAYHHCTLLVDTDRKHLTEALKTTLIGVKTNASMSVKSSIMNLKEANSNASMEKVIEAITSEYYNSNSNNGKENVVVIDEHGIDEADFPGVSEIKAMFLSDEWRLEKTPKFEVFREVFPDVTTFLVVEKGRISDVGLKGTNDVTLSVRNDNLGDLNELFNRFIGKLFDKVWLDEFEMVTDALRHSETCRAMLVNR